MEARFQEIENYTHRSIHIIEVENRKNIDVLLLHITESI